MRTFWTNVGAGTIGAVVSALAVSVLSELGLLGLHLIIPQDAVILISGNCPSGWRPYDPARGIFLTPPTKEGTAEGLVRVPRSGTTGSAPTADLNRYDSAPALYPNSRLVIPEESVSIVLTLCQRRER